MRDTERSSGRRVLTVADIKLLDSVVFLHATLPELFLLLLESQILKLGAVADQESTQGISETYYTRKRAVFIRYKYAMFGNLWMASKA